MGRRRACDDTVLLTANGPRCGINNASMLGSDPGGAMAGFEVRVRCPTGLRGSANLQLIGGDEAGHLPSSHLGLYEMSH